MIGVQGASRHRELISTRACRTRRATLAGATILAFGVGAGVSAEDFAGAPESVDVENVFISRPSVAQVSRAMGFLIGQGLTIETMAAQHPGRAAELRLSEMAFAASFRNPAARAEAILRIAIGDDYDGTFAEMKEALSPLSARTFSLEEVDGFMVEIGNRADGIMDPETLATLLWLRYNDEPASEMADGWREQFSAAEHVKSMGLAVSLDVPLSWLAQEGDRPHVVQTWTSQNGTGLDTIQLLITEALVPPATHEEVQEVATLDDWSSFTLSGFRSLEGTSLVIDGLPALRFDQVGRRQTLDVEVAMVMRSFYVFAPEATVHLQCVTSGASEDEEEALRRFSDVTSLCHLVAASLVIPGDYGSR